MVSKAITFLSLFLVLVLTDLPIQIYAQSSSRSEACGVLCGALKMTPKLGVIKSGRRSNQLTGRGRECEEDYGGTCDFKAWCGDYVPTADCDPLFGHPGVCCLDDILTDP